MTLVIAFLVGALTGTAVMWWVMHSAWRHSLRPHALDGAYEPAKRVVIRHLRVHGTLNVKQLERMMDIRGITALRYLDQMVHDGLLTQQGHRGSSAFYTLT